MRGHSSAITHLTYSSSKHLLYSASLDSTIRVWRLPTPNHTTYAAFDATRSKGILIGHTDAVWDLALVRDEGVLVSCGADGAVKVWDVGLSASAGALRLSWGYDGLGANGDEGENENKDEPLGATTVEAVKTDLKKVAVAYRNAVVKIFDIDTGKQVGRLQSDMSYGWLRFCRCLASFYLSFQTGRPRAKSTSLRRIQRCPSLLPHTRTNTFGCSISPPVGTTLVLFEIHSLDAHQDNALTQCSRIWIL